MRKFAKVIVYLLVLLVGAAGGYVVGKNSKKGSTDNVKYYMEQTFSTVLSEKTQPLSYSPLSNDVFYSRLANDEDFESNVVSIKLKEDGTAYLIHNLVSYSGTYTVLNDNGATAKIEVLIEYGMDTYCLEVVANAKETIIKDKEGSKTLVGTEGIKLTPKDDLLFENGLYRGIGSYHEGSYTTRIESGSYTYKINDNEIYSSDSLSSVRRLYVEKIGNNLVYKSCQSIDCKLYRTDLFFVETKGNHSEGFVDTFGDLEYVIYHLENEGSSGISRYYHSKVNDSVSNEEFLSENLTLKSTNIKIYTDATETDSSLVVYSEEKDESVNVKVVIKTDGTLDLLVTENQKYNVSTTGKWYVTDAEYKTIIAVLEDKSFLGGTFALIINEEYISEFLTEGRDNMITDTLYISTSYDILWEKDSNS